MLIPEIERQYPHLSPEQIDVISHKAGPLAVVAGPGSGKTTTVILRAIQLLASGHARPEDLLISTFSRQSAKDLQTRFLAQTQAVQPEAHWSEVQITTIHGLCQNLLRAHGQHIIAPEFQVLDDLSRSSFLDSRLPDITTKRQRTTLSRRWGSTPSVIQGLAQAFDQIVEQSVTVRDMVSATDPFHSAVGAVYLEYEEALRVTRLADFAHLLRWAHDLLCNPASTHIVNERIHAMVDEYQDTTPLQARIFRRWTAASSNLMVVGDDNQSIYAFRGARADNLRLFAQSDPGCRTIHLSVNRRSHAGIAAATSEWMQGISGGAGKDPTSEMKSDVRNHDEYPSVMVVEGTNPCDEAQKLATACYQLKEDCVIAGYEQIALLLHSVQDRAVAPYRDAFIAQGIPHSVRQQVRLMDHPDVRRMVACLAIIFSDVPDTGTGQQSGDAPFCRYLREAVEMVIADTPPESPLARALARWPAQLREAAENGTNLNRSLYDYFYALMAVEPFSLLKRDPETTRTLAMWSQCIHTFHQHYGYLEISGHQIGAMKHDLFERFLPLVYRRTTLRQADNEAKPGHVQVMTIHESKGREFPVTVVGSLAHNPGPHEPALDLSDFSPEHGKRTDRASDALEQSRCKYVGFTRAAHLLLLSGHGEPAPTVRTIWIGTRRWSQAARRSLAHQRFPQQTAPTAKPSYSVTGDLAPYRLCPRRYQFFIREGFVQPATHQTTLGLLVHRSIDGVHRRALAGLPLDDRSVREIVGRENTSSAAHRDQALRQVRRYVRDSKPIFGQVLASEMHLRVDLREFIMTGRTDLITQQSDGLTITDIKTGRPATVGDEREVEYSDQVMLYAHMVEERYQQPVVRASVYWTDAPDSSDATLSFDVSKESMDQALEKAVQTADRISAGDFAVQHPPPNAVCNGCALKSVCRRDGTIVPAPVRLSLPPRRDLWEK